MRKPNSHQGFIVGLTHTEIMLIFAVVILLLWMAREEDFLSALSAGGVSQAEIENLRRENAELKKDIERFRQKIAELEADIQRLQRENAELKGQVTAFQQKKADADVARKRLEELEELYGQLIIILPPEEESSEGDAPSPDGQQTPSFPDAEGQSDPSVAELIAQVEKLVASLKEAREKIGAEQNFVLKGKIGFIPCWLDVDASKVKHYPAYSITYTPAANGAPEKFVVKPSGHWNVSNKTVQDAVNGGLPSLAKYPTQWVNRDQLVAFGARLNREKNRHHDKECRLATYLNEKGVDGTVVRFIRDKVHLYPIYRSDDP